MARTSNTQHDATITKMIAASRSVTDIAKVVGVSDPTVYKAIHRLGLTLPTKAAASTTPTKSAAKKAAAKTSPALNAPAKRPTTKQAQKPAAATSTATDKNAPEARKRTPRTSAPNKTAAAPAPTAPPTPSVELVPVAQTLDLLTVRVDKGVELLKNLSARIVKNERELATLRQRYADTLAALALN